VTAASDQYQELEERRLPPRDAWPILPGAGGRYGSFGPIRRPADVAGRGGHRPAPISNWRWMISTPSAAAQRAEIGLAGINV
jgi:hypothetical protein